jgi:hypothetical protein
MARIILQNENSELLEAIVATEGRDLMAIVELRAEDTVVVIFKADINTAFIKEYLPLLLQLST